jgi:hypothetical protein
MAALVNSTIKLRIPQKKMLVYGVSLFYGILLFSFRCNLNALQSQGMQDSKEDAWKIDILVLTKAILV